MRRPCPIRRSAPAFIAIAPALVAAAAAEFAFRPITIAIVSVAAIIVAFALEALARRTVATVLARRRCALGRRGRDHAFDRRRIGAGLSEIRDHVWEVVEELGFAIGRQVSEGLEREKPVTSSMPAVLSVTASTEDGVAMAIEHKTLPVGGVQFHPESLMSLGDEVGLRIVENAFRLGVPVN